MTKFLDGPAKGIALALKMRPARLLRVVQNTVTGKWDALDAGSDTIQPDEKPYAYVLVEYMGMVHVNRGAKGSGFYPIAEYALCKTQPAEEIMRDNERWFAWVKEK